MILEHAEYSIREYLNSKNIKNKLSFQEVLAQMLEAVQELHSVGYVHSDIKSENFRIMNNRVVLIDFGCLKSYLNVDKQHIDFGRAAFAGSLPFASLRQHQGKTPGRRDDIVSLGFCILELIDPSKL